MHLPQAILWALWPWTPEPIIQPSNSLNLTLRHVHGHQGAKVVFKDILDHHKFQITQQTPQFETSFSLTPRMVKTYKPRSQEQFFKAREQSIRKQWLQRRGMLVEEDDIVVAWDEWDVPGPDSGSRETLLVLAKMTWNSYLTPDDSTWYDLGSDWGQVRRFTIKISQNCFLTWGDVELSFWMGTGPRRLSWSRLCLSR
jgi:putative lipase involved disintegration of autophagic bodies